MLDTYYLGDVGLRPTANSLEDKHLAREYSVSQNWRLSRHVMGPGDLIARRQELSRLSSRLRNADPRPTICFVLGIGEDADRASTRIGGLPYWPRKLSWPLDRDSTPQPFIAQFDFRPIDWPEELPGDVLTIHFDHFAGEVSGDTAGHGATLTWHTVSATTDLVDRKYMAALDCWSPGPFYALPISTTDFKLAANVQPHFAAYTIHGMKIGGHSPLFGTNWLGEFRDIKDPVFLCSLGYVNPDYQKDDPKAWLPSTAPSTEKVTEGLIFLDLGTFVVVYPRGRPNDLHWITYLL